MVMEPMLTPAQVALLLNVDVQTVARWAREGKIDAVRTPGGHRRYRRSDVEAMLKASTPRHTEAL